MHRRSGKRYIPRILPCPFKCGLFCKSASGLTQHRNICSFNPANCHEWTPPSLHLNAPQTPPTTPLAFGPICHTPPTRQLHTPGTVSPHCYQWSVNRRGTRSRIHPFLDGKSLLIFYDDLLRVMVPIQVNPVMMLATTFPTTVQPPPESSMQLMITSLILPTLNSN
jgi:hypothetical protein